MKRLTLADIDLAAELADMVEDLCWSLSHLDDLSGRVLDSRGPLGLENLHHEMKVAIYRAAREVAEVHDPAIDPLGVFDKNINSCCMSYPQASCRKDCYDHS